MHLKRKLISNALLIINQDKVCYNVTIAQQFETGWVQAIDCVAITRGQIKRGKVGW